MTPETLNSLGWFVERFGLPLLMLVISWWAIATERVVTGVTFRREIAKVKQLEEEQRADALFYRNLAQEYYALTVQSARAGQIALHATRLEARAHDGGGFNADSETGV